MHGYAQCEFLREQGHTCVIRFLCRAYSAKLLSVIRHVSRTYQHAVLCLQGMRQYYQLLTQYLGGIARTGVMANTLAGLTVHNRIWTGRTKTVLHRKLGDGKGLLPFQFKFAFKSL